MVESLTQQQSKLYNIEYILTPSPSTERGFKCSISSNEELGLFAYCSSNVIVLKSVKNLNESQYFLEHNAKTTAVKFNPKLKQVASGDEEGNLIIWDIQSLKILKKYEKILHQKIIDITWTINGDILCVVGEGKSGVAKAFVADSGKQLGNFQGHSKTLLAADFQPCKKLKLLVGGEDQVITCYDGQPLKFTKTLKTHQNYVNFIKFNQKGDKFISGSSDKSIIIYDTESCNEIKNIANAHENSILSCCWLNNIQNEEIFITSACDKQLKIWEAYSGSLLRTLKVVKENPTIEDQQLGVAAINNQVISVSFSGKINIWQDLQLSAQNQIDLPTLFYIGHQINSIINLESQNSFVTADVSGRIIIWSENQLAQKYIENKSSKKLILSQNHESLYNLTIDSQITQISVSSFQILKQIKIQNKKVIDLVGSKKNSQIFFVLSDDKYIQKYENLSLVTETKINVSANVTTFEICHNDKFAFVGDDVGNVHKINIEQGQTEKTLNHFQKKITCIKISLNEKFLVVGDNSQNIKLWDNLEYTVLADTWSYHNAMITSLNFSQSSKFIVSSSIDCKILIWNTETFSKEFEIQQVHNKGVYSAIFDKNGRVLTSGGDNLVKIIKINKNSYT